VLAGLERRPAVAGVFVNTPLVEVNRVAAYFGLDWVQLSGDETWHYCRQIKSPFIKAVHVPPDMKAKDVIDDIEEGYRMMEPKRFMCLLDTKAGESYGGTGKTFNWQLAKEVSGKFPVLVAGGLDPDNVKKLISDVHPWGVDVSSGVESGGKKDPEKITAFINTVRETEPMSGNDRLQEGTIE
jgi:phosphoribosylanthranilate isomerase